MVVTTVVRKELHRLDIGSTMWPRPFTSPKTMNFNFSNSNFEMAACRELLVWLMWNEKEANQLDIGPVVWTCALVIPMTLALIFKVKVWNSFISGLGGSKGPKGDKWCESIVHDHDCDLWVTMAGWLCDYVTMAGWVYVRDSDRGHFKRSRVYYCHIYIFVLKLHVAVCWPINIAELSLKCSIYGNVFK